MTTATQPKVKLLIVGLGRQGQRHARVAASTGCADLVGTVDPNQTQLAGVPHFPTLDAALDGLVGSDRPDAAIVSTSVSSHSEIAIRLLESAIPVLVEKPMAVDAAESELMVAAAANTGTLLAVGHVERFNPSVRLTAAALKGGSFGNPVACAFRRVGLSPPNHPDVNVIQDLGVHDIDVFGLLTGSHPAFSGATGWVGTTGLVESAHVLLTSAGVHGLVEVNWRTPVRLRSFSITTDSCLVQVDYTRQSVEVVEASTELDLEEFSEFRSHYGAARRTQIEVKVTEPLADQMAAFVAAVRGEASELLADGEHGLAAVRAAELATKAISGSQGTR